MNPLRHVAAKLNSGQPVTVGYFGGSHTDGGGASDPKKTSWRALTTAWLQVMWPAARIREVNAAISGTNSLYGMFRIEQDLLMAHPDIVFLDFGVVDLGIDSQRSSRCLESIIRQILKNDSKSDIVILNATNKWGATFYDRKESPRITIAHEVLASYYGLPSIAIGRHFWQSISDGVSTWESLTKDGNLPLDAGHDQYFQQLKIALLPLLVAPNNADSNTPHVVPPPINGDVITHGHIVDAWSIAPDGWVREENALGSRYPHQLIATTPGSGLTLPFTGRAIGFLWMMASDGGDIRWHIDDQEPRRLSSWDVNPPRNKRPSAVILSDSLENGNHQLHLRVIPDKNEKSEGTTIRIGAFLVGS